MTIDHMVDTSALARRDQQLVEDRLEPLVGSGRLGRCLLVDLELLRGYPGSKTATIVAALDSTLGREPVLASDLVRAREVQLELAASGSHHGTPAVDLVIAAVAERAGATLLHYDADFDRIAEVTGQSVEWVVPAGDAE